MFAFPFSCSGIPDLALGISKMLILLYIFVMYYNQQSFNLFLASLYGKYTVCTVNIYYFQVLTMYKNILN